MRTVTVVLLGAMSIAMDVLPGCAQDCVQLHDTGADQVISYLNTVEPNPGNQECISFALSRLGTLRYEPAVSVLARWLDFRRPPTDREKQGLYLHAQTIDEIYPAASALEELGQKALPEVLSVIRSDSSPKTARANAVFVWMEIYKSESPKGVTLLRQEADRSGVPREKQNLQWAVTKAVGWCNPPDEALCRQAAGKPGERRN